MDLDDDVHPPSSSRLYIVDCGDKKRVEGSELIRFMAMERELPLNLRKVPPKAGRQAGEGGSEKQWGSPWTVACNVKQQGPPGHVIFKTSRETECNVQI